jgi:hypothetical protein
MQEHVMQKWLQDGGTITINTDEPHVYSTEHEFVTFLRQHLAEKPYGHWLVFTRAEERILDAQAAAKPYIARRPIEYLDNMVLSLLRADGMRVRPCFVYSQPPDTTNVSPEHVAVACNFDL